MAKTENDRHARSGQHGKAQTGIDEVPEAAIPATSRRKGGPIGDDSISAESCCEAPEPDPAFETWLAGGKEEEAQPYEVGRGKPPKEHQFQKGRSANPGGRPKPRPGLKTLMREELGRTITLPGGKEEITVERLVIRQLVTQGGNGNLKAAKLILPFFTDEDQEIKLPDSSRFVQVEMTEEELRRIESIVEEHGKYYVPAPDSDYDWSKHRTVGGEADTADDADGPEGDGVDGEDGR